MDDISLSLIASVSNLQEDLIVIFEESEVIFTNDSFNRFFNVSSTQHYNDTFGEFVNNFVPHPSYFNKDKIEEGKTWVESISKLNDNDRVVSMLSQTYEPCAFSVDVDQSVNGYSVVVLKDITQDLIKRIMIQNNANIDESSGAYSKKYFQQIAKTYEDAARFNEKIIATLSIIVENDNDDNDYKKFVDYLSEVIRQDDMLTRWGENKFLLVFMVDKEHNAKQVLDKFNSIILNEPLYDYKCHLNLNVQNKDEKITTYIKRI